jgi:small subunit ribosomal protein S20
MPLTKSTKKTLRQSERRRIRNIKRKKKIRGLLKEVKDLVSQNKKGEAKKMLPRVYKALDKLAKVGLFKKNTVDRKKSRITKLINKTK